MSLKTNKQFGVWMDSHHATVVGMKTPDAETFEILEHIKNVDSTGNSSEKTGNNATRGLQLKFFKEIAAAMQNAEEVHVTGTGTSQEQFIHYLADTAQFKNVVSKETTSNKMSDEQLVAFITEQY